MKTLLILALLLLTGCYAPPRAVIGNQDQPQARDTEHAALRHDAAMQEYWEWERGDARR
jgi:hypothetical protein